MPVVRRFAVLSALLLSVASCQDSTGLAGVAFAVSRQTVQADPGVVAYRFVVINQSDATIWMNACNRIVSPDIDFVVGGRTVDTMSGGFCLAIYDMSPIALEPGQSYEGERAVPYRAGVQYRPSLGVSSERTLQGRGGRLQAAAFEGR